MDRYTRKDAEKCLDNLLRVVGKQRARSYNDVGGWVLDYNPIYGGVIVEEIMNTGGGVDHPLGEGRHSPKEFCHMINFTIRAIEVLKGRR